MTKRELLASTAAVQPIEPQREDHPQNKPFRTVKNLPLRDNARAKRRRSASAAKRGGGDGDGDGDGDGNGDALPQPGPGYKLGPHVAKPVPADAIWLTSNQVCARYAGRSQMWQWRKINHDPAFPKPTYFGRMMMFSRAELDAYDRVLISKRAGAE
jgi:hypothetical protein